MSGMVKVAGQPRSTVKPNPVKLLVAAALAASIGAGGFAIGRSTADQAASGGSTQAITRPALGDSAQTRDQQRRAPTGQQRQHLASQPVAPAQAHLPPTFGDRLIGHRPGH